MNNAPSKFPSKSPAKFAKKSANARNNLIFTAAAIIIAATAWQVGKLLSPDEIEEGKSPKKPYMEGEIEPGSGKEKSRQTPKSPEKIPHQESTVESAENREINKNAQNPYQTNLQEVNEENADPEQDPDSAARPYEPLTPQDVEKRAIEWTKKCLAENEKLPQQVMLTSGTQSTFNQELCGSQAHIEMINLEINPGQLSLLINLSGTGQRFNFMFMHDDSNIRYDNFCQNIKSLLASFKSSEPNWFVGKVIPALKNRISNPVEVRSCVYAEIYLDEQKTCYLEIFPVGEKTLNIATEDFSGETTDDLAIGATNVINKQFEFFLDLNDLFKKYNISSDFEVDSDSANNAVPPTCMPLQLELHDFPDAKIESIKISVAGYDRPIYLYTKYKKVSDRQEQLTQNTTFPSLLELENWIRKYYLYE